MPWNALPCMRRQNIQRLHHLELSTSRIRRTRSLSTQITNSHGSAGHDIYVSTSTSPYFNLALENWLFRHSSSSSPLLLIYRDSPCVVIGRHQNPWTEINFTTLKAAGIPFLRRWSGGGAVYHDLGNTNFSIHLPRSSFNRKVTGELVLRAVRSLGVDARLNERNDILVGPDKMSSAYKIVNKRALHHGTMLLATRLDTLGSILRPLQQRIVTKSVSSVRSPVSNLQEFNADITHKSFTEAVVAEFRKEYQVLTNVCSVGDSLGDEIEHIRTGMSELSTWDCMYGQTPEFNRTLSRTFEWGTVNANVRSRHGIILDCQLDIQSDRFAPSIAEMMRSNFDALYLNQRYGFPDEARKCSSQVDLVPYEGYLVEVGEWLKNGLEY